MGTQARLLRARSHTPCKGPALPPSPCPPSPCSLTQALPPSHISCALPPLLPTLAPSRMQVRLHVQHCFAAVEARAWDAVGSTHAQLAAAASAARTAAHTGSSGAGPAGAGGVLRLGVAGVTSMLGSGLASVVQVTGTAHMACPWWCAPVQAGCTGCARLRQASGCVRTVDCRSGARLRVGSKARLP